METITDQQRAWLFFCGCIPLRTAIAYYSRVASPDKLRVMGFVALMASIAFFVVWASGSRNKRGAFGGVVWWNDYRLIHSIILLKYSIDAIAQKRDSWKWLALDVAVGSAAFITNRLQ